MVFLKVKARHAPVEREMRVAGKPQMRRNSSATISNSGGLPVFERVRWHHEIAGDERRARIIRGRGGASRFFPVFLRVYIFCGFLVVFYHDEALMV